MRSELSGLEALLAVAERKSFTAAAVELGVSPSAVSQTVRAIEERVGVRLVQRTTRSVGLTEAGVRFVSRLRPAMAGVRGAFEALGELRDRPAGLLRVTLPRLAHQRVVAPRLSAFLARYPEISLELSIDDAFVDVIAQGFDAGIRIGEMVEREMVSVRIGADMRSVVAAAPAYLAAHVAPRHPRELAAHDCINYRRRALGVVYRWEFVERGRDFEVAVNGRILINDGELMADAAVAGLGVAYLTDESARPHLASGQLVSVLDAYCPSYPGFYLYYPSRTHIAPKLAAFVDFLRVPPRGQRRR